MKVKGSSQRRAISPLIATLILIAITVVGGVVVYSIFLSTSSTVSTSYHITITSASVSLTGGLSVDVKNDGSLPITPDTSSTVTLAGSPCLVIFLTAAIPSGGSFALTDTTACGLLSTLTLGATYGLSVTVVDYVSSNSAVASLSVAATG